MSSRYRHINLYLPLLAIVTIFSWLQSSEEEAIIDRLAVIDYTRASRKIPCQLSSEGPLPVILMSLGRSGSSITWDTMSALTGKRSRAYEITGGNQFTSKIFFDELADDPNMTHDWAVDRLCFVQKQRDDVQGAGIAGFQWKPYMASFDLEYAVEGLKTIASHQNPPIRIVYLTRNPIDRKISNLRHERSKSSSNAITAHCAVGDDACIKEHAAFDQGVIFPVGNKLLNWLRYAVSSDNKIKDRLRDTKVKFIQVSYEKLYSADDDAEEWMRIFKFLSLGPSEDLSMDDIRATFSMASTHSKGRNEIIENYVEVEQTLAGTEFEHFLL
jgi:hypothetical protein